MSDVTYPTVHPDLFRSNQWPFHLRVCRDKWEMYNGEMQLELNFCRLTPGAGGVTMPLGTNLSRLDDSQLLSQWVKQDRGSWRIIREGDDELRDCDALHNGHFMHEVIVRVYDQTRRMILPVWETINDLGMVVENKDLRTRVMRYIAAKYFCLTAPTQKAADMFEAAEKAQEGKQKSKAGRSVVLRQEFPASTPLPWGCAMPRQPMSEVEPADNVEQSDLKSSWSIEQIVGRLICAPRPTFKRTYRRFVNHLLDRRDAEGNRIIAPIDGELDDATIVGLLSSLLTQRSGLASSNLIHELAKLREALDEQTIRAWRLLQDIVVESVSEDTVIVRLSVENPNLANDVHADVIRTVEFSKALSIVDGGVWMSEAESATPLVLLTCEESIKQNLERNPRELKYGSIVVERISEFGTTISSYRSYVYLCSVQELKDGLIG